MHLTLKQMWDDFLVFMTLKDPPPAPAPKSAFELAVAMLNEAQRELLYADLNREELLARVRYLRRKVIELAPTQQQEN